LTATSEEDLGEVYEADGRLHVRYVRRLAFPVERVWAALTIPERIADWLGDAEVDPVAGGRYHISSFRDDATSGGWTIRRIAPPRLLEFASDESGAPTSFETFELEPDGAGCVLTLTCSLDPAHAGAMGGWHMFLDALPGAVTGVRAVWDEARHHRHQTVKALYRAKLAAPDAKTTAG
jgi:uncharacterized protein YndB with AHSA1/START domain